MTDDASRALDDAFLAMVASWNAGGAGCDEAAFDAHARATFAYQLERNAPYARWAASLGVDGGVRAPRTWREIPAVPASAFRDAVIATFDPLQAELAFRTSGTTHGRPGTHYVERAALYDASLLAGFDRAMLPEPVRPQLRYLSLVPNPRYAPHSSLGYMMGHVAVLRGDGKAAYFLEADGVDAPALAKALDLAAKAGRPVCIAATAFALTAALDALEALGRTFATLPGSRVMETGGFKGRTREVSQTELYARTEAVLGIPRASIVAEYGMTELLTQYYDAPDSRGDGPRVKVAPPWLRTLVVDAAGAEVPEGEMGFLRHVDLANRSSAVAVETDDRGYRSGAGIVLAGRDLGAPPRGCSLDAEALLAPLRA